MTCNKSAGTICIRWGNPYTREVLFKNGETPINLTGYTIIWALKRDLNTTNDNTASAKGVLTINADQSTHTGKATLLITSTQTKLNYGTYHIDFKMFDADDVLVGNTSSFSIEIVPVSTQDELPEV